MIEHGTIEKTWGWTIDKGTADAVKVVVHEVKLTPPNEGSRLEGRQYTQTFHFEDGSQYTIASAGDKNIWFGEGIGVHHAWTSALQAVAALHRRTFSN
jgi:hypothetical protein